jgi:diguanylate cyclase (GGDEF)-like protein/PAS domain S-box-containing protein
MSLKSRFALLVILGVTVLSCSLIAITSLVTGREFLRLEKQLAETDLRRVAGALAREQAALERSVRTLARFDDTWDFANHRGAELTRTALRPDSLRDLDMQLALVTDVQGRTIFSWLAEPVPAQSTFLPLEIPAGSGLMPYGGRLYLVGHLPVSRSDGSGAGKAGLMLGREIDADFIAQLSRLAQLPLTSHVPGDLDYAGWRTMLGDDGFALAVLPDHRGIQGLVLMKDLFGADGIIIGLLGERPLSAQLPGLYGLVGIVSLAVALLLAGLIWLGFDRSISRPLTRLAAQLRGVDFDSGAAVSFSAPPGSGRDEIASIVRVFNELYDRLAAKRMELLAAKAGLESEVGERTARLVEANHELGRYARILAGTSEGVIVTGLDGVIVEVNDAMARMTGYDRGELIGMNSHIMNSDRHPPEFYQAMWAEIAAKGHWTGEIWDRRKNGEIYAMWLAVTTLTDDQGQPAQYVGLASDISRIKEAESRLNQLAYYDSLTGLPNRSLFRDRLGQALSRAQRGGFRVALLYLDLDRFKLVNDTQGHAAGDSLLMQVGQRLLGTVRESDTVCRLGGDEFMVLLEAVERSEDVAEVCRKICANLQEPFGLGSQEVFASCSIGVALFPFDGRSSEELIQKADEAMYQAKDSGRANWRFASGQVNQESRRRMDTEAGLRYAIARDEFLLYYQPQYDAAGGLVGAEALIRWRRNGAILAPGDFIDIAEESNLICAIGAWALSTACAEAKSLADAGRPLVVSVNVSPRQFAAGDLPRMVATTLTETGLDPRLLKLEVTESLFMKDIDKVVATMKEIRGYGVAFAVDDFGVGFSSLNYLIRLPLDCMKIDKSFVDGLDKSGGHGEIVAAIISMARAFNLSTIAEGVETEAQLERLKAMGCGQFQGYLTGRPMPEGDFHALALAAVPVEPPLSTLPEPNPAPAKQPRRPRKASPQSGS